MEKRQPARSCLRHPGRSPSPPPRHSRPLSSRSTRPPSSERLPHCHPERSEGSSSSQDGPKTFVAGAPQDDWGGKSPRAWPAPSFTSPRALPPAGHPSTRPRYSERPPICHQASERFFFPSQNSPWRKDPSSGLSLGGGPPRREGGKSPGVSIVILSAAKDLLPRRSSPLAERSFVAGAPQDDREGKCHPALPALVLRPSPAFAPLRRSPPGQRCARRDEHLHGHPRVPHQQIGRHPGQLGGDIQVPRRSGQVDRLIIQTTQNQPPSASAASTPSTRPPTTTGARAMRI